MSILKPKKLNIIKKKNVVGTEKRPRIAIYRSNKYISAQVIDDTKGITLTSVSEKELNTEISAKLSKKDKAQEIGKTLSQKMKQAKINQAVFDRRRYKYQGRVAIFAEAIRKGGVKV